MFEKSLADKIKNIFDLDKVSYDTPSESQEQEGVFIRVTKAKTKCVDARQIADVTGVIHIFGNIDKLPYGYMSKQLEQADADDVRGLFFYDFEENKGTYRNIAERSVAFRFLFDSQFDPALGTITSVNFSFAET